MMVEGDCEGGGNFIQPSRFNLFFQLLRENILEIATHTHDGEWQLLAASVLHCTLSYQTNPFGFTQNHAMTLLWLWWCRHSSCNIIWQPFFPRRCKCLFHIRHTMVIFVISNADRNLSDDALVVRVQNGNCQSVQLKSEETGSTGPNKGYTFPQTSSFLTTRPFCTLLHYWDPANP